MDFPRTSSLVYLCLRRAPDKPFQPSLIFASKARACPSGVPARGENDLVLVLAPLFASEQLLVDVVSVRHHRILVAAHLIHLRPMS
jgi:hypothetical protein